MAYLLIPNASDKLKVSQAQIQTNFTEIQTSFDVNHEDFDAANTGMHKFIQFTLQGSSPATAASQIALWNAVGAVFNTIPNLWVRGQSNATPYSLTEGLVNTTSTGSGWCRFGNSSLVKWGSVSAPAGGGAHTLNFPAGGTIPAFNNPPLVFVRYNQVAPGASIYLDLSTPTPTATTFTITKDATVGTIAVNFLAIGS